MTTATMMDAPLTIELVLDRADRWTSSGEVVSRRPDRTLHRTTYGAIAQRARKLARALVGAGIRRGDCVATLMWNHAEHLEAYFGIPLSGGVTHTLNLRLHPEEIAYIANDAKDRFIFADRQLAGCLADLSAELPAVEGYILMEEGGAEPPTIIRRPGWRGYLPAGAVSSVSRMPIQIVGTPAATVTRSPLSSSSRLGGSRNGPGSTSLVPHIAAM